MSSYASLADALTRIEESRGNALARGQEQRGAIWGHALGDLGSLIAGIPQQRAQLAEAQQRQQFGALQLDEAKRQRQSQQLLDAAYQQYGGDIGKLTATLADSGQGHLIPSIMENHAKYQDALAKAAEANIKVEASHAQLAAQVGAEMQGYLDEGGPDAVKNAAGHGLVRLADLQKRGILPDATARQFASEINPDDEQSVRGLAKRLITAPRLLDKPSFEPLPANSGGIVNKATGQITPTGVAPRITNESELLLAAGDPTHPLHQQAVEAVNLKKQPTADQIADNARQAAAQNETMRHNRAEEAIARARENRETSASNDDAKAIADAIISGDQPPSVQGLYRYAGPVRAALAKHGYDFTRANLDWEATKKHLSTLNGAQQTRLRQAISTASDSLGVIEDLATQWDGGKFPLLNKATLAAARNGAMGPKAQQIATNLTAQITDVTSELGNVYMGGNSPTDHALQLAGQNLSADWTRDQLLSAIKLARTNLQIRQNSIANSGAVTTSGVQGAASTAAGVLHYDPATGTVK